MFSAFLKLWPVKTFFYVYFLIPFFWCQWWQIDCFSEKSRNYQLQVDNKLGWSFLENVTGIQTDGWLWTVRLTCLSLQFRNLEGYLLGIWKWLISRLGEWPPRCDKLFVKICVETRKKQQQRFACEI
jgi:hypothetical protein